MTTITGTPAAAPPARPVRTDVPTSAAFRPRRSDGTGSQRWELLLYPTPTDTMSVTLRYLVTPGQLSVDNPFPLGGRQHAETLLASCLAVAEEREKGGQGPAFAKFMQRLSASIHLDKQSEPTGTTTWKSDGDDVGNSIKSLAGLHMGFGQNPDAWTENQRQEVMEAVRQGLRRFYVPPPLPGRRHSHQWSFLTPLESMSLEAGKSEYDLPSDFGGMDSPMTYVAGDNVLHPSIEIVGEHHIRRLLQGSAQANGRPIKAGFHQKAGVQEGGTQYQIVFWPVPDDAYTLNFRYRVQPGQSIDVIHGGDAHFQTILEAVRSAADSMQRRRQRPHEQLFMERLQASVMYDEQLAAPRTMGYNRDQSVNRGSGIRGEIDRAGWGETGVTYNGRSF